jgi:hypothetical protein
MTSEQIAVDAARLGRALIDQARLGDAFAHSVGTSAEQSAYERLRRAGAEVNACDRRVKQGTGLQRDDPPSDEFRRVRRS